MEEGDAWQTAGSGHRRTGSRSAGGCAIAEVEPIGARHGYCGFARDWKEETPTKPSTRVNDPFTPADERSTAAGCRQPFEVSALPWAAVRCQYVNLRQVDPQHIRIPLPQRFLPLPRKHANPFRLDVPLS